MKHKRGQVSIFIIGGVILILIVGIYFALRGSEASDIESVIGESQEQEIGVVPVSVFAQQCIEQTLEEGFYWIGFHGGYLYLDSMNLGLGDYSTSYLYYEGNTFLPAYQTIEDDLTLFLSDQIGSCFNNFSDFPDYEITGNIESLDLIFAEEEVVYHVMYPFEIRKGSSVQTVSDFSGELDIRFSYIYDTVRGLLQRSVDVAPYLIDFDYLESRNLNSTTVAYENNSIVYVIIDSESKIDNEPYTFVYAAKVDPEYVISREDISLRIQNGTVYADMSG
ncbi:hypothetical protein GF345_06460 [Candidatus Woesearchaeota archaeon]|nr:hypothetical protein [Candidatus Woesearchaeota archaeon]